MPRSVHACAPACTRVCVLAAIAYSLWRTQIRSDLLSPDHRRTYYCSRRTPFLSSSGFVLLFTSIQPEMLPAAEIYGRMKYGLVRSEKVLNAIL